MGVNLRGGSQSATIPGDRRKPTQRKCAASDEYSVNHLLECESLRLSAYSRKNSQVGRIWQIAAPRCEAVLNAAIAPRGESRQVDPHKREVGDGSPCRLGRGGQNRPARANRQCTYSQPRTTEPVDNLPPLGCTPAKAFLRPGFARGFFCRLLPQTLPQPNLRTFKNR